MSTVETSPHSRTFGVEIEFGVDLEYDSYGDRSGASREFLKEFGFAGDDYWQNSEGWAWGGR